MLSRRGLLLGLTSLIAAPAVVRASSLMPVSNWALLPRIGDIKPIIGVTPPGWIECNGRWLVRDAYPLLFKKLAVLDEYGPSFMRLVPDLREQAAEENNGRYFIYAGQEAIAHRASIDRLVEEMKSGNIKKNTEELKL